MRVALGLCAAIVATSACAQSSDWTPPELAEPNPLVTDIRAAVAFTVTALIPAIHADPVRVSYVEALERYDTESILGTPRYFTVSPAPCLHAFSTFIGRDYLLDSIENAAEPFRLLDPRDDPASGFSMLSKNAVDCQPGRRGYSIVYIFDDITTLLPTDCYARHTISVIYTGEYVPLDPDEMCNDLLTQ